MVTGLVKQELDLTLEEIQRRPLAELQHKAGRGSVWRFFDRHGKLKEGPALGPLASRLVSPMSRPSSGIVPWARRSGSSTVMSRALACPRNSDGNLAQSVYRKYEIGGRFAQRKIVANQPMHRAIFGRIQTRALTPLTFVRAPAAARSAPLPECSIRGAVSRPFSS
jgi:hypothetical protein